MTASKTVADATVGAIATTARAMIGQEKIAQSVIPCPLLSRRVHH